MPDLQLENLAMGAGEGVVSVPLDEDEDPVSQMNSLLPKKGLNAPEGTPTLSLKVSSVDVFCAQQKIEYIDLLKTDTEGFELEVLKGASRMLGSHSVGAVLVEVRPFGATPCHRVAHVAQEEVSACLERFGFDFWGLYDICYTAEGRILCGNALYKRKR